MRASKGRRSTARKVSSAEPGAGGIVWRRVAGRWRIALVERSPSGEDKVECSLPKGHIEPGETHEQAALREVAEEVGWRAELIGEVGTLRYTAPGRERAIRMWSMRAVREAAARPVANAEEGGEQIFRHVWLRPKVALKQLTHDEQALFLAAVIRGHPRLPGAPSPLRSRLLGDGRRRERLRASLDVFETELRGRVGDNDPSNAVRTAFELLRAARECINAGGDVNTGWTFVLAAQRVEILDLKPDEIEPRRQALLAEARRKLDKSWRGQAIEKLLSSGVVDARHADETSTRSSDENKRLVEAMKLRDEYSDNIYRRLDHTRVQLTILGAIAFVLIAALLALLTTSAIPPSGGLEPLTFLGVALFGALGGAFSGAISLMRVAVTGLTVPEVLTNGFTTIMRPLVGAVGAVALYAFLQAGLFTGMNTESAYAVAFAAGFSERLVSRVAESVSP